MSRPTDARPDDAVVRVRVETFALVRRVLPIGVLAGSLVGPLVVVDSSNAVWLSMALFFGTLFVLRTLHGLPLYPAHTFGIEYRFENERFESDRRRCVRCGAVIDDGIHRRYARQFVLLGVPVHTFTWGDNDFCPACLEADSTEKSDSEPLAGHAPPTESTGRGDASESAGGADGRPAGDDGTAASADSDSDSPGDDSHTRRPGDGSGTDIVRRVDPHDEPTALEIERAFDGE